MTGWGWDVVRRLGHVMGKDFAQALVRGWLTIRGARM